MKCFSDFSSSSVKGEQAGISSSSQNLWIFFVNGALVKVIWAVSVVVAVCSLTTVGLDKTQPSMILCAMEEPTGPRRNPSRRMFAYTSAPNITWMGSALLESGFASSSPCKCGHYSAHVAFWGIEDVNFWNTILSQLKEGPASVCARKLNLMLQRPIPIPLPPIPETEAWILVNCAFRIWATDSVIKLDCEPWSKSAQAVTSRPWDVASRAQAVASMTGRGVFVVSDAWSAVHAVAGSVLAGSGAFGVDTPFARVSFWFIPPGAMDIVDVSDFPFFLWKSGSCINVWCHFLHWWHVCLLGHCWGLCRGDKQLKQSWLSRTIRCGCSTGFSLNFSHRYMWCSLPQSQHRAAVDKSRNLLTSENPGYPSRSPIFVSHSRLELGSSLRNVMNVNKSPHVSTGLPKFSSALTDSFVWSRKFFQSWIDSLVTAGISNSFASCASTICRDRS